MTLIAVFGAFLPILLLVQVLDLGLGGVWAGIAAFVGVRMVLAAFRWHGRKWLVAGTLMVDERPLEARS
jgi:Na+-driven multidrug efflux pump